MITLDGLSKKDIEICNLLWNCDSIEAVDKMVAAMPSTYRSRAVVLRELMTAAAFDNVDTVNDELTQYLQRIASR